MPILLSLQIERNLKKKHTEFLMELNKHVMELNNIFNKVHMGW